MSSWLTPERIAEMQKWLLEHPIDHKYDKMCEEKERNILYEKRISNNNYTML